MELYADVYRRMRKSLISIQAVGAGLDAFIAARGKIISGFGHRFHPIDPALLRLLALVDEARAKGTESPGASPISAGAVEAEMERRKRRRIPMNIDGVTRSFTRSWLFSCSRARAVHLVAVRGHPGSRVGTVEQGRPHQGADAAGNS